ncbi:GPR1/FUN34/yaaH family-domain-containing protein [Phlyctochytrium arcticum]|nr:GPR1/FUN34/yaaH family-domain-containing protein [Phlyctochytrium arcticum]
MDGKTCNDTIVTMNDEDSHSALLPNNPPPQHMLALHPAQLAQLLALLPKPAPPTPPSGLGNPGPLGLAAFATTTFVLSCFNTGVLIDKRLEGVVLPLGLFYGGIAQFAAGMWEYQTNNTFGATAFTSYGAFWMSFAAYVYFIVPTLAEIPNAHYATGLYLLAWTIFTLYMTVAAWRVSRAVFAVFFFLSITFFFLTVGTLADHSGTHDAGGWFGLITAFTAWYGSGAVVINSTFGRAVLPVGTYVPPKRQSHDDYFNGNKNVETFQV